MHEFCMPALGADMESGTLLEWEIKPGATVKRGDIIATVGTEKGEIGAEVYVDGVLAEILVEEGEEVSVGTVLALIRMEEEEAIPAGAPLPEKPVPAAGPNGKKAAEPHPMDQRALAELERAERSERVRISPLARKVAAELGVDLGMVVGTGPHGAISRGDVERAATKPAEAAPVVQAPPRAAPVEKAPPPPPRTVEAAPTDFQQGMRRAIARAMARANRDIPHYYLETRIDMTPALTWLEQENLRRPIEKRLLPAVLLIKAVAKALAEVPELNGFWVDDHLAVQESIHIGFAIALRQGGLITPAIHHADLKSLDELMENLRDLIVRTRENRLRSSEMTDATVTVTSLGDLGVETVYGVIYPPQVALVGLGKITEQPWVADGMIGVRKILTATLAGDHRASDGRSGGRFLAALNRNLQEVESL